MALFPLPLVRHIKLIALRYYGDRDRKREPSSRNDKSKVNTHYYLHCLAVFKQTWWLRRVKLLSYVPEIAYIVGSGANASELGY